MVVFFSLAVVTEHPYLPCDTLIICSDRSSLSTGAKVLSRIKAEGGR